MVRNRLCFFAPYASLPSEESHHGLQLLLLATNATISSSGAMNSHATNRTKFRRGGYNRTRRFDGHRNSAYFWAKVVETNFEPLQVGHCRQTLQHLLNTHDPIDELQCGDVTARALGEIEESATDCLSWSVHLAVVIVRHKTPRIVPVADILFFVSEL